MGILEIHFHESDFSWTVNPRTSDEGTPSPGSGESSSNESASALGFATESGDRPGAQKLWMLGALAVFVGLGVGFGKLRSRRKSGRERESSGRRLSLSRSK